jgi:hypothetical protein
LPIKGFHHWFTRGADEMRMRQFDRYHTGIPFRFISGNMLGEHEKSLKDMGQGGLCFRANGCLTSGTRIQVSIPFAEHPCRATGKIIWCHRSDKGQYELGIEFSDTMDQSILEEIDRIEDYKNNLYKEKGQRVTSEEAARLMGLISHQPGDAL